jgi:hypothetical protein
MNERLPVWLADGAEVSGLAYRIVSIAFGPGLNYDPPAHPGPLHPLPLIKTVEIIEHLARRLDVDEADVLRAMAELEHVGAFETVRG